MMRKTRVDREWLEHELLAPRPPRPQTRNTSKTKSPTSSEPHSSEIGIASSTPRLFRRLKHKTQVFPILRGPFRHAHDPHHSGEPGWAGHRPRFSVSTRISPRRFALATMSAIPRSGIPGRTLQPHDRGNVAPLGAWGSHADTHRAMNLTAEVLDGIRAHSWRVDPPLGRPKGCCAGSQTGSPTSPTMWPICSGPMSSNTTRSPPGALRPSHLPRADRFSRHLGHRVQLRVGRGRDGRSSSGGDG